MGKRVALLMTCALLLVGLTGCTDYKGLDELAIVSGFTVDISDKDPEKLRLTFELVDTARSDKSSQDKTFLSEGEGRTIPEAIAQANQRMHNELYFGNTEILIVHEDVARLWGLNAIMESLLRDFTIRDTMLVVIAKDGSAESILEASEETPMVVAYEMAKQLDNWDIIADATWPRQIYEIYTVLMRDAESLVLPAVVYNHEVNQPQPQLEGMAVFKGDELIGFMAEEDVRFFLFSACNLSGGTFVCTVGDDPSGEITHYITATYRRLSYEHQDGRLTFRLHVDVHSTLRSISASLGTITRAGLAEIEAQSAQALAMQIKQVLEQLREALDADVIGLGKLIYQREPTLWRQLKPDWDRLLQDVDIQVTCEFWVENTGQILNY